jgi:hypothetical protein
MERNGFSRAAYHLYNEKKFEEAVDYSKVESKMLLDSARELTTLEEKMKAAVMVLCNNTIPFDHISKMSDIDIYNNKILVVNVKDYTGTIQKDYAVRDDGHIINVSGLIRDAKENGYDTLSEKTGTIKIKDLTTWMIENHVGRIYRIGDGSKLITNTVSAMGQTIEVTFFDGNNIMREIDESEKKIVEYSFAELEALRKKIGKNISKAMIPELKRLSPIEILNLV